MVHIHTGVEYVILRRYSTLKGQYKFEKKIEFSNPR